MAFVTVTFLGSDIDLGGQPAATLLTWNFDFFADSISLGTTFTSDERRIELFSLPGTINFGRPSNRVLINTIDITNSTNDLSTDWETEGMVRCVASDGTSVSFNAPDVPGNNPQDSASTYIFFPLTLLPTFTPSPTMWQG